MLTENNQFEKTYALLRSSLLFLQAAREIHEFSIDLEDWQRSSGRRDVEWTVFFKTSEESQGCFLRGCTLESVCRQVKACFAHAFDEAATAAVGQVVAAN